MGVKRIQVLIRIQIPTIFLLIFFLGSIKLTFCQGDQQWKKQNEKVNRYEGRISLPANVPPIKLISFYGYQESFSNQDILMVRFYLYKDAPVYIIAQEIEIREYYWMEAKQKPWKKGWNEFGPWPVKDVLAKLGVPSDNLGVLLRLSKDIGSGPIAPVVLYHTSPPIKINQYTAYFRPGKSISGGRYEIYKDCNNSILIKSGQIGRQNAGVPFPVKFSLLDESSGLIKIKITVNIKNELSPVPPSREFCFYHTSTIGSIENY